MFEKNCHVYQRNPPVYKMGTAMDASLQERYNMFLERKRIVDEQIKELEATQKIIEHKCWYYRTALEAGTEDIHKKDSVNIEKLPCE